MGDDRNVRTGDRLLGAVGENALEMRKPGFHVLAVGSDERRWIEDRVINAKLVALAQQRFCQIDVRALTEIVAAGLETEPEQGDPMTVSGNDAIDGFIDRQPVARQCAREQRYIDALGARQIEKRTKVLWKA